MIPSPSFLVLDANSKARELAATSLLNDCLPRNSQKSAYVVFCVIDVQISDDNLTNTLSSARSHHSIHLYIIMPSKRSQAI
jgi:hypothetical protein